MGTSSHRPDANKSNQRLNPATLAVERRIERSGDGMATTGRIGWAGATVAALGVNAVVLALLSIEDRRARTPVPAVGPVLYLDIEPLPSHIRARLPATNTQDLRGDTAPFSLPSASPEAPIARAPQPVEPAPVAPAPGSAGLSREWLERRDRLLAHRAPSGERAPRHGPPNCAWPETLTATEQRRCQDFAVAQIDPRNTPPQPSGDEDRTSRFTREAAAKKRWRDYRAGEGEYPGLRSLFGKN